MTYAEIISAISFRVWGNTTPPQNSLTMIQSMVQQLCRRLQQDYDYWFMETWAQVTVAAYQQAYDLPDNIKQIINLMWAKEDGGYSNPLRPLTADEAHRKFWRNDESETAEYPEFYEISASSMVLYPDPLPDEDDETATRTLQIVYWKFLDDIENFITYEDDFSTHGADVLINLVTSEMLDIIGDTDKSQRYGVRGAEALTLLKHQDYKLRQKNLTNLNYGG